MIFYVLIASFDDRGCYVCGDREGSLCWLIVICVFVAIVMGALGLVMQCFKSFLNPE